MESEPDVLVSKIVSQSTGREFFLNAIFFQNGCFVIITEGEPRIGAVSMAISASNKVSSAKIIPSKYDSIFINTLTEKVSSMINGISLVSIHCKIQLQLDDMKTIMGEVIDKVGSKSNEHQ